MYYVLTRPSPYNSNSEYFSKMTYADGTERNDFYPTTVMDPMVHKFDIPDNTSSLDIIDIISNKLVEFDMFHKMRPDVRICSLTLIDNSSMKLNDIETLNIPRNGDYLLTRTNHEYFAQFLTEDNAKMIINVDSLPIMDNVYVPSSYTDISQYTIKKLNGDESIIRRSTIISGRNMIELLTTLKHLNNQIAFNVLTAHNKIKNYQILTVEITDIMPSYQALYYPWVTVAPKSKKIEN